MNYDDAKKTMTEDEVGACSVTEHEVDITKANEFSFCCEGADMGDTTDTMFAWVKVSDI